MLLARCARGKKTLHEQTETSAGRVVPVGERVNKTDVRLESCKPPLIHNTRSLIRNLPRHSMDALQHVFPHTHVNAGHTHETIRHRHSCYTHETMHEGVKRVATRSNARSARSLSRATARAFRGLLCASESYGDATANFSVVALAREFEEATHLHQRVHVNGAVS